MPKKNAADSQAVSITANIPRVSKITALKTSFPERLKQLRRDAGMLQSDLAEQLDVSKSAVSGWEVGRNQPCYDILIELSILFGVSVDYLIGRRNY